jgi:hypothetical protein
MKAPPASDIPLRRVKRDLILTVKFHGQQSSGFLGETTLFQVGDPEELRGQLYVHRFGAVCHEPILHRFTETAVGSGLQVTGKVQQGSPDARS